MPWFDLCFDCNEKEKQKPTCEICGKEVPEGHYLCTEHWKEKKEEEKKLKQIDYVKDKKETDFREKFEGKFYFNGQKVKSKSELLLLYFFEANGLRPRYEDMINSKTASPRNSIRSLFCKETSLCSFRYDLCVSAISKRLLS